MSENQSIIEKLNKLSKSLEDNNISKEVFDLEKRRLLEIEELRSQKGIFGNQTKSILIILFSILALLVVCCILSSFFSVILTSISYL